MTSRHKIPTIEKEKIKFLRFPKQDVFLGVRMKQDRYRDLQRALWLGNMERHNVTIIFEDDRGSKKVETTVWGVTEKSVILKQSTIIPLQRILKVN